MFAYCLNCPVCFCDKHGNYPVFISAESEEPTVTIPGATNEYGGMTKQEWHEANRRPNTGDSNSEFDAPNGDKRFYDEDGKPYLDYDHDDHNDPDNHPHDENGGHWHRWSNGKREKGSSSPFLGALKVIGGVLLIAAIYADDLTGIGEADNAYADQVIIWIKDGWDLLFN